MTDCFVGEIRLFAFGRAPAGWWPCDGTLLSIGSYSPLYSLIGTAFGGDGVSTFGLPDLRGRVPVCPNESLGLPYHPVGETGGVETVSLTAQQMPSHTHAIGASQASARSATPGPGLMPATVSGDTFFVSDTAGAAAIPLHPLAIATTGQGQAHGNMMPTTVMQFCMALNGIYPSRS